MSFRLAKQRDFRNNSKKESKQKIPLDSFKQHFYRQPALTEPFQYPEEYRKTYDDDTDDTYDTTVVNPIQKLNNDSSSSIDPNTIELRKKLIDEQKERKRRLRMTPQIIDVYRVEDEVEDSLETLENYFHDFVLQLRSSESKSTGSVVTNETLDEQIRRRSISAYANEISNNHMNNELSQNEDSDL